nr:MAG: hypothetical protein [Microvirus sp.]
MQRKRQSPKQSKRQFKKTANRTHKKNLVSPQVMRGGYRL